MCPLFKAYCDNIPNALTRGRQASLPGSRYPRTYCFYGHGHREFLYSGVDHPSDRRIHALVTRIMFATDVHGSEQCFRKFVNAAKYKVYKSDIAILSGDITGKTIVPIVEQPDGSYKATIPGKIVGAEHKAATQVELKDLQKMIRDTGYYPYVTTPGEIEGFKADRSKLDLLIKQLMLETVQDWVKLAEERLKGSGVKFILTPGNDDILEVDDAINESTYIINAEGRTVSLDEEHEMITSGYTNPTPWKTPRELSEQELAQYIDSLASDVRSMERCVFNFHCPPYDSSLDTAPKLGRDLTPTISALEGYVTAPAGSTAIRTAIEKYQPVVGLHGHIHESAGEVKIGRTLCLNPGSEYHDGMLEAYLVDLDKGKIKFYIHVEA